MELYKDLRSILEKNKSALEFLVIQDNKPSDILHAWTNFVKDEIPLSNETLGLFVLLTEKFKVDSEMETQRRHLISLIENKEDIDLEFLREEVEVVRLMFQHTMWTDFSDTLFGEPKINLTQRIAKKCLDKGKIIIYDSGKTLDVLFSHKGVVYNLNGDVVYFYLDTRVFGSFSLTDRDNDRLYRTKKFELISKLNQNANK